MQQKTKQLLYQIAALIVPMVILILFLFLQNNSFRDLLISDAGEQYTYLFQYLKEVLEGKQSLFYNFSKGLGGAMYGTFFYYLASPLNLLLIFIPSSYVFDFLGFLMILKIGLSGFTMYYYLKRKEGPNYLHFILSLSYALMSYNIMYYFNVMWLDVVYLTPLVILGLDNILNNKKSLKYILFLFLAIISNCYIAYMLCIFIVIYFIYKISTKYSLKKDKSKIIEISKKFIISSLLAGLLASFMMLPVLNELHSSVKNTFFYGSDNVLERSVNFLFQFGIQKQSNSLLYFVPYFFCGYFVFSILINYFLSNKKDKDKNKIIIVFIIFFLSIILKSLICLWHGFAYPVLFNYRWTFLISFFVITIACEKYKLLETLTVKKILIFTIIHVSIIFLCYVLNNEEFNVYIILINAFFCFSNMLFINILLRYSSLLYKLSLIVLFLLEIFIVLKLNFLTKFSFSDIGELLNYSSIIELNNELEKFVDTSYRIGGNRIYQQNELFNTSHSSISIFLSTVNGNVTNFFKNSGYTAFSSVVHNHKNQDALNNILGIRYWYQDQPSKYFQEINSLKLENENIKIYENKNALSLGFLVDYKKTEMNNDNPFVYQNAFFNNIGGENIFEKLQVIKKKSDHYQIETNGLDSIYLYISEEGIKGYKKTIYLNDKLIEKSYFTSSGILKLPLNTNENIYDLVIKGKGKNYSIHAYKLNREKYNNFLKKLHNNSIYNLKKYKNKLEFDVSVKDNSQSLLLTIPYEKGWHIFVDGKELKYDKICDTFINVKLNDGKKHIIMYYIPYGLALGLFTSFIFLIITIVYVKK